MMVVFQPHTVVQTARSTKTIHALKMFLQSQSVLLDVEMEYLMKVRNVMILMVEVVMDAQCA